MAKGFKSGGRDWKPGESGNPDGQRNHFPPEIKKAMEMNKVRFVEIANSVLSKTMSEIKEAIEDPSTTADELMVLSLMKSAIDFGDPRRMDALLNRLIGKVQQEVKVDPGDGMVLTHSMIMKLMSDLSKKE